MTQDPSSPGVQSHLPGHVVSAAQGALDETFNRHTSEPLEDVEAHLRGALADAGVEDLPPGWVEDAAAQVRAGEPVVVTAAEDGPDDEISPPPPHDAQL
jgi:hypothetical protein